MQYLEIKLISQNAQMWLRGLLQELSHLDLHNAVVEAGWAYFSFIFSTPVKPEKTGIKISAKHEIFL